MINTAVVKFLVPAFLALAPIAAQACGELRFNAGRGLPFQSYIAPRPADVLVVRSEAMQDEYLEALEEAGHRLTIVTNADAVATEIGNRRYDIVIAGYDALDAVIPQVEAAPASPQLLPIVGRSLRKDPLLLSRFSEILLDGASLGQYLTVINRVVSSRMR
jgi:hypothetical protein